MVFPFCQRQCLVAELLRNSCLHEKYQLDSWLIPQQLTEGVDKQIEGEQAELN